MLKYQYFKDKKKRKNFFKSEKTKILFKYLTNNTFFSDLFRLKLYLYNIFKQNTIKFSKTIIKNRCIVTNRSKATLSFFKLSRIEFRSKASKGLLSHIRKASW